MIPLLLLLPLLLGNLAYKVTDQSLRHTLETALSEGSGTVADVRIAEEQGARQNITKHDLTSETP